MNLPIPVNTVNLSDRFKNLMEVRRIAQSGNYDNAVIEFPRETVSVDGFEVEKHLEKFISKDTTNLGFILIAKVVNNIFNVIVFPDVESA